MLGGVTVIFGLARVRFDMDLFSLLPEDLPLVEGLKLYQREFGSSQELIVSLRAPDAETAERAARSLAKTIERSGLAAHVLWQSPLQDEQQLAGLVAYLWFNQPPERFRALTERFRDAGLEAALDHALERMASSLAPQEIGRLGRDPYALTDILQQASTLPTAAEAAGNPFASPDGRFRVVLLAPPFENPDFGRLRQWTREVRALSRGWQRERPADSSVRLRLTGNPALIAESGSALLRDIRWAAASTLVLVACLFWLAHRSWRPLAQLVLLLLTVLACTTALGGLLLGDVNVVSLGFAAILLGLAADYGMILYQELRSHARPSTAGHGSVVASILWAAATTAGAFFMLTRSSLPGVTQLGLLVGLGILVAAAIMLVGFLGPTRLRLPRNSARMPGPGLTSTRAAARWSPRIAWGITLTVAAAALLVLQFRGLPVVDYGAGELGFPRAEGRAALAEVERELGPRAEALWLIVSGADEGQVSRRLQRVAPVLERAVAGGVLARYALPAALVPRPEAQQRNRAALTWLAGRQDAARDAALAAGFTAESLRLTENVFSAWDRIPVAGQVVWPQGSGVDWILRQFSARSDGRLLVLGRVEASAAATDAELASLAGEIQSAAEARLVGWSLLSDSLLRAMQQDVQRVLIPLGLVLLLLLWAAFRNLREIVLSLATLALSFVVLLAFMSLVGWRWNLMNVMALALLLGTGVDYSIHIQLALQRHGGNILQVRRTVGRAILLCGASTASGFGALAFASNVGLASLGRVCATGIVAAGAIAVFLLPGWWRTFRPSPRGDRLVEEER